jgi:CheY-like chemotaxis protein
MPSKKIVLSNDASLRAILENSFFWREGFELVLVRDGQTGFQAVEEEAPTLALFDLEQLGEQALECCREIKRDPLLAVTPVLLLVSEQAEDELVEACRAAGCDAVVRHPLKAEDLLGTTCGLLGISPRLERRLPVNFELLFLDSKQKQHVGNCTNFNSGGMFVATEKLFPVDTVLKLEFTLPGFQKALNCSARVAWVNHPEWRKKDSVSCGLGLQFISPRPTLTAALQECLEGLQVEV